MTLAEEGRWTDPSAAVGPATGARPSTTGMRPRHLALAPFQERAVSALAESVGRAHARIAHAAPGERAAIAREIGTSLLAAPTGAGKTLMLGRTLETLVPDPVVPAAGFKGAVWFWFAPYSGLVEQTRMMLRADCPGLRLRDLTRDREPGLSGDGDVFVHTWASVAARNREARRLRRSGERALSVDDMIEALREDGFFIGCVIDEAHLNFGTTAKAAAAFYLEHLAPDTTLLATATPRDAKLAAFLGAAGMKLADANRVEVPRSAAVEAGLNKRGLVAAQLVLTGEQRAAIDPEETIVLAAWRHHERVKERVERHGLALTPLLLVQVPNDTSGSDEAERARQALIAAGAPEDAIRIHTSGQPDPEFHALANDEDVEVLVFKLSAATGFDAPRAFSLVSLRPVVTADFGLQVVGRVMRVDPRVRASGAASSDPLLSRGTVFLGQPSRQGGLEAAADLLAAFRECIAPVTPQLSLLLATAFGGEESAAGADDYVALLPQQAAAAPAELGAAASLASAMGRLAAEAGADDSPLDFGFFADTPEPLAAPARRKPGTVGYALRRELGVPECLMREKAPELADLPDLAAQAAAQFRIDDRVLALLLAPITLEVTLKLRELLLGERAERSERFAALPSPAKLAEAAQGVFAFHEDIDPRLFRRRLIERFRAELRARNAVPQSDAALARVIDSVAVFQKERIRDALNRAMALRVEAVSGEPIPDTLWDVDGLHEAARGVYGVFPSDMNGPERRFAEWLDRAEGVLWWLRNPSHPHNRWAVRLVLSHGAGFHPDFVVGVSGRRTEGIRLAEVKDDGTTGRLQSDENHRKVRARHALYFEVLFVAEENEGTFQRLAFSEVGNRIVTRWPLTPSDLQD